jgi:hypothetical protein
MLLSGICRIFRLPDTPERSRLAVCTLRNFNGFANIRVR